MGEEDIKHLKFERVGTAATLIGAATAWMGPNPVSMLGHRSAGPRVGF